MFKPLAALMSESERESLLVTRETKVLLQDFRGSTLRAAKKGHKKFDCRSLQKESESSQRVREK